MILVTGANGYIGSHLVEYLSNMSKDVYGTSRSDCDLDKLEEVISLSQRVNPDIIIHTAAKANSVDFNNAANVMKNVISTANLLEVFPKSYHIFLSSIVVYNPSSLSFGVRRGNKINPKSIYGLSKKMCEELYDKAHRINDTPYTVVRPCAIVGGNVTHGIVKAILDKLQVNDEEIELFGVSPGAIKPYVHISDLCVTIYNLVCDFYSHSFLPNVVIIGNDSISIKTVAETIFKKLGISPTIKWNRNKVWKTDNKKIKIHPYYMEPKFMSSTDAILNYDRGI